MLNKRYMAWTISTSIVASSVTNQQRNVDVQVRMSLHTRFHELRDLTIFLPGLLRISQTGRRSINQCGALIIRSLIPVFPMVRFCRVYILTNRNCQTPEFWIMMK